VFMVMVFICVLCVDEVCGVVFTISINCVFVLYRVQGWNDSNGVGRRGKLNLMRVGSLD
jgi:MFS superfamily sulfate permease-like transporter